ncbi:hypothetical protein [Aeromonas jandaei]|uniref:hypothetical protein n=1 Tax=Aeromonas jandaei TaxID=650 RepID=UPI003BA0791D
MIDKEKSDLQERVVRLYLRLNGFITDGFIAHSPTHGNNLSEIDVIGVRFPYHSESEREVPICKQLNIQDGKIYIIVGEVKSNGQRVSFNKALKNNIDVTRKAINRIGFIHPKNLESALVKIHELVQDTAFNKEGPAQYEIPSTEYSVSAVIFKPETNERDAAKEFFITGPDIMNYMWDCFKPEKARCGCATIYNFALWGEFEEIVRYVKSANKREDLNMESLYSHIEKLKIKNTR